VDAKVLDVMGQSWVGPEYFKENSDTSSGMASVSSVRHEIVIELARVEEMRGEGFCECAVDAAACKNVLHDRGLVVGPDCSTTFAAISRAMSRGMSRGGAMLM